MKYLIVIQLLIIIIIVLISRNKKKVEHHPLTFDDSHKYVEGYNRAKQVISNGSDADQLLKMSNHEEPTQSEWLRGYRQACTDNIKQRNKVKNQQYKF